MGGVILLSRPKEDHKSGEQIVAASGSKLPPQFAQTVRRVIRLALLARAQQASFACSINLSTNFSRKDAGGKKKKTAQDKQEVVEGVAACCCGCGVNARKSCHICSVTKLNVFVWCHQVEGADQLRLKGGAICKGCFVKAT